MAKSAPHVEPTAIVPHENYVGGHFLGNTFSGPSGKLIYQNGQVGPVVGVVVNRSGMLNSCRVFHFEPDHDLKWDGKTWTYEKRLAARKKVDLLPVEETAQPDAESAKQEILNKWSTAKFKDLRDEVEARGLDCDDNTKAMRQALAKDDWAKWKAAHQ